MCIATKLVGELESVITSINTELKRLNLLQKQLDNELNKQYHKIERANFNAAEGYCLSRELQIILRKRRVVKDELYTLRRMKEHLNLKASKNNITKAKQSLNNIHNSRNKSEWQKGWKDHFRAEEMHLQH